MLKLHGFPMSPNTRRAWLMLEEVGASYTFVNVDLMTGEQKQSAYLRLNPTGRVPTLEDGAFRLWESNAILVYLAEKFPAARLAGADAMERAEIARWTFMNAAHLSPSIARVFAHTIRLPEEQRLPRLVDEARLEIDRCLRPLDARLADREFLTDRFTMAEVAIAPTLSAAPMLGIDLGIYPHVARWMTAMKERPAWTKTGG